MVHRATAMRRVNQWVSDAYLTPEQLKNGVNYTDLCIFLFAIRMSRGYEDESLILQVFFMFINNIRDKYD